MIAAFVTVMLFRARSFATGLVPLAILGLSCAFIGPATPVWAENCEPRLESPAARDERQLAVIRARLSEKVARQFTFKVLEKPTVAEARGKNWGIPDGFLDATAYISIRDEDERVIPLEGAQSRKFVRLYRAVRFAEDVRRFDVNQNYKNGNENFPNWRGDFVTHLVAWAWFYAGGVGRDLLAEYLIPAMLLEIDVAAFDAEGDQEPYYVISREKLRAAGIQNVGVFLNRLARVDRYRVSDPHWDFDPRFDNDSPGLIGEPPRDLDDPKIRWIHESTLKTVIRNGEP